MKSEDELKNEYYRINATRPIHPNIAILQTKLDALRTTIEAVEVNEDDRNSYDEAVEKLLVGIEHDFEEFSIIQEAIPTTGGTEAEEEAVFEIEQKIKELAKKRWQKLDDIGYERPEDSRADLFPNGEDED